MLADHRLEMMAALREISPDELPECPQLSRGVMRTLSIIMKGR
ncbi:MAG: hypothetical protein H6Q84_2190 [Deltaproteobacteria bacterium]|nr:hypothetical protein [Deltaproteobacteria bacterium]